MTAVNLLKQYECERLNYDIIKWPVYKELVYRRRQMLSLPCHSSMVRKMMGLKELKKDPETIEKEAKEVKEQRTNDIIDKVLQGQNPDCNSEVFAPELV